MTIIGIGLDTAKDVFQVHGVDEAEQPVLRGRLRRSEVEKFVATLPPARIGLEACGASHHWARRLGGLGHQVVPVGLRSRQDVWDPVRATHLGQRSPRPRTQAGHMTAID
jgi:hypothetical protein